MSWLTQQHPDYQRIKERERFTWDHYTGEALDVSRRKASQLSGTRVDNAMTLTEVLNRSDPTAPYLLRRSQGEAVSAYKERLAISRFPRHMSKIMGTMVGGIVSVEKKAKRQWGEGLGDPADEDSFIRRFMRDTDGNGTNYPTMLIKALTQLVVSHRLWYIVEPGPMPRLILLDAKDVDNWLSMDERLYEVKVKELVDTRTTIKDEIDKDDVFAERWMLYDQGGYERWREDKGKPVMDDSGNWKYPFKTDSGDYRLPLGCTKVPLLFDAGYRVAQSCNSLFNLLSDARWLLRVSNHPRLVGRDVTKEQWEAVLDSINQGQNALMGDWAFINPDPSNAKVGFEMYKEEVREVYVEAFQIYEEAAQVERTATEIDVEETKGRRSILAVIADTLDEFENDVLFLLEQTQNPTNEGLWRTSQVKRSRDFKPIDPEKTADRIMLNVYPGGVELPPELNAELMKRVADGFGIDGLDDEIEAWADRLALNGVQREAEALLNNGLAP